MLRNVGGQAIGAEILGLTTGRPFEGPVTCYVTGDGGVQVVGSVNGGLCEYEGTGLHNYKPSQSETNFRQIAFTFDGGPLSIPATVQVITITEAQMAALSSATVTTVIGDGPTKTELLKQIAHRLNKTPPPNMDSATETRLMSYINQRQRRLASMPGLQHLRHATVVLTTEPDEANYGLPYLSKVERLWDVANERVLYEMSLQDYRLVEPNPTQGTPEAYVWTGRKAVRQHLRIPAPLYLASTSADDVALRVYIEGTVDVVGTPLAVTVTLSGTTPVNIASTINTWHRIDKCYLAQPCRGTVRLFVLATGTTPERVLTVIQPGAVSTIYAGVTLWPTPSALSYYGVDIVRPVSDLVQGTDQTLVPDDFSDLLVLGALADEYQHLSDSRWQLVMTEYKERENQLKYWLYETAIGKPLSLTGLRQGSSQLGPWFPAGT